MLSVGIEAACFGSTAELLQSPHLDRAGCLVLDVRMPGPSGLDLQQHLAEAGIARPIVFLTGHGDIPMSVQAMRAGAVDRSDERRGGTEGGSTGRTRGGPDHKKK